MKVNFQRHATDTLVPRREHIVTHRMGCSVGPTTVMDIAIKRENPVLCGIKPQPSNT
jgi:hypothetical protein